MGYYQDCECEIPIYDVTTRYNPRLRNCKADGRLQFFYRVTFVCRTFHDLLMAPVSLWIHGDDSITALRDLYR